MYLSASRLRLVSKVRFVQRDLRNLMTGGKAESGCLQALLLPVHGSAMCDGVDTKYHKIFVYTAFFLYTAAFAACVKMCQASIDGSPSKGTTCDSGGLQSSRGGRHKCCWIMLNSFRIAVHRSIEVACLDLPRQLALLP